MRTGSPANGRGQAPDPGREGERREGRWQALRRDVAFRFERLLTLGTYTKVAVLWVILAVVGLAGGALALVLPSSRFTGLGDAFWWALLRLSDPGHLTEDTALGLRLLSIVLTVLGLALFVGVLIAILTQALTQYMDRLALGLTPVRFVGHVAVLGWTNRTLEFIAELLEDHHDPPRVVVLVERITAEIEHGLRYRLPRRLLSRVVLRTGDPERLEDLARINGRRAEAIVVPGADRQDGETRAVDPRVLKIIASVDRTAGRVDTRPRIVAEIVNPQLLPVAHAACAGPLQIIVSEVLVGRSLALGILAPRLSQAMADLLDVRAGSALRVEINASLAGESIVRASGRYPNAVLVGAIRRDGTKQRVESAPDVRLEAEDQLLFLAPVGAVLETLEAPPWGAEPGPESGFQVKSVSPRRVLVLGWSGKVRELCRELADQQEHHLEIDIVSPLDPTSRESQLPGDLNHMTVRHIVGDATTPDVFAALDPTGYDCVVLIGSDTAGDRFEADSRTITTALLLSHRFQGAINTPHVIAEVLDSANRAVLEDRGIELVVTPLLMARVLAGAVMHPELGGLLEQMIQGRLGRIGVISLQGLVEGGKTDFGAIERSLRLQGIVCLGLQREAREFSPELAPDKREPLRIGPRDHALVVRMRSTSSLAETKR